MQTIDRYHQLTVQHAYERRIAAEGLSAILEPYLVVDVRVPEQRSA